MRGVVFIFTLLVGWSALAERLPLERYQSIIDRQMFGEPPPGFDPTRPPSEVTKAEQRELSKEQEKLQSSISFSVINVTPQGDTMVGFSDNSEKPPKHYYLKVGEENGGWLVKEADPVGGTMTIQKDNIEVSLTIGGNSANDPNANSRVAAATSAPAAANRPLGGANAARSAGGFSAGSLRQRRLLRQQQAAADAERRRQEAETEAARQQEEAARQDEENAKRAAEREEMRANLLQVQEQLKKVREAKEAEKAEAAAEENAEEE